MYPEEKLWSVAAPDLPLQRFFSQELGISPVVAQVLLNRGITDIHQARLFLSGALSQLRDARDLPGVTVGVARILEAVRSGERVLVYGDYDVDGVTATALLVGVLRSQGGNVSFYIPARREEGYGLNSQALAWAHEQGFSLVITVDCGITSVAEVALGNSLGLDVIITDHHEPAGELPPALAVINPKLAAAGELLPLAGVGVAFKLAQALLGESGGTPVNGTLAGDQLDLVALGTIADVVPLVGENRILVKYGLPILATTSRPGLRALIEVAGIADKPLTPGLVAFVLAPRINAAGRLGDANPVVDLLLTHSSQHAWDLARRLNRENEARQAVEMQISKEVAERIAAEVELEQERVVVLASPLWHAGVVGIAASRVVDRYHRPAVLIALEGETGKGSARSIPDFPINEALHHCRDLLLQYGGHRQAAGLSIRADQVPALRSRLNDLARDWLEEEQLRPRLRVDTEVLFDQIDEELVEQLESLAPFGYGNPEPVLAYRKARMVEWRAVGKNGNHLKFTVRGEGKELEGIGFNLAALQEVAATGEPVDLAFSLARNHWQGKDSIQLSLQDFRPHHGQDVPATLFLDKATGPINRVLSVLTEGRNCQVTTSPQAGIKLLLDAASHYWSLGRVRLLVLAGSRQEAGAIARRVKERLSPVGLTVWQGDGSLIDGKVDEIFLRLVEQPGMLVATPAFFRRYKERLSIKQFDLIMTCLFTASPEEQRYLAGEIAGSPLMAISGQGVLLPGAEVITGIHAGQNIRVTDLRGSGEPLQRLQELIAAPGGTVVWTERPRVALGLVQRLQGHLPRPREVVSWHRGMSWQQKQRVTGLLENGLVTAVVAAGPMDAWLRFAPGQVVFWEYPLEPAEMMFRAPTGSSTPEPTDIYLLDEGSPGERGEEGVNANYLDRERLGRLYMLLRHYAAGKHILLAEREVGNLFRRCGLGNHGGTGLAVLEELGLVKVTVEDGGCIRLVLPPVPERKLELASSWRYMESRFEGKITEKYRAVLREPDPGSCIQLFGGNHEFLWQVSRTDERMG